MGASLLAVDQTLERTQEEHIVGQGQGINSGYRLRFGAKRIGPLV